MLVQPNSYCRQRKKYLSIQPLIIISYSLKDFVYAKKPGAKLRNLIVVKK